MNGRRIACTLLLVGVAGALLIPPAAWGALIEEDEILNIKRSVAVLRYLNRQKSEIDDQLKSVSLTRSVTEKQLAAQQDLIRREKAKKGKANPIKLAWYERTFTKLRLQKKKLDETNLEKVYQDRTAEITKDISEQFAALEAKIEEFKVHFGHMPDVDLEVTAKVSRLKPKVAKPRFLKL